MSHLGDRNSVGFTEVMGDVLNARCYLCLLSFILSSADHHPSNMSNPPATTTISCCRCYQASATNSKAFRPAFQSLEVTRASSKEAHVWRPPVLVTTDFEKTVSSSNKIDDYLRPVQWIVSGKRTQQAVLVILSPYEADYLILYIRSNNSLRLHLYTRRIVKFMKPCDDLALCSIPTVPTGWISPSLLMDQLDVFAG